MPKCPSTSAKKVWLGLAQLGLAYHELLEKIIFIQINICFKVYLVTYIHLDSSKKLLQSKWSMCIEVSDGSSPRPRPGQRPYSWDSY